MPENEQDVTESTDCGCDPSIADLVETLTAAATTIVIPDLPPMDWFEEPIDAPPFGAITVTNQGRIYGFLAPRNVAHRGYPDRRVTVPTGNVDYSRWMNREALVAGGRMAAGPITMDCGHAATRSGVNATAALDHYDNACSIVATARVGENANGVWVAGALVPGVSASQIARLLASQLSGDWRPSREQRGKRELCGVLAVPVPGFAMPNNNQRTMTMDDGQLVASSAPIEFEVSEPTDVDVIEIVDVIEVSSDETTSTSMESSVAVTAAAIIARSIGRDELSRASAIAATIRGE